MTKRLEEAIKKLTPQQEEMLATYAESMTELPPGIRPGDPPKMDWVGCLQDSPWRSGLEAQEAAKKLRIEMLMRGMPR